MSLIGFHGNCSHRNDFTSEKNKLFWRFSFFSTGILRRLRNNQVHVFTETIIRLRFSEYLGGEYALDIHLAFGKYFK